MQPNKSRFFFGYFILACCFLFFLVMNGTLGYSMSLFVTPLSKEFGWNRAEVMGGPTLISLMQGLGAPVVGRLVPRFGAKKIIAFGAITMLCTFSLLSLTQSLWQYYLFSFLAGIASAGMGVVPGSMVVANWFHRKRGWAIGLLGSGIGVGGFIMPLIIGNIFIPEFSWRGAYLVTGLLIAITVIPLDLLVIRTKPEDMGLYPDGASEPPAKITSIGHGNKKPFPQLEMNFTEARKTPAFWLMAITFMTFSFGNQSIMQNQAPQLQGIGFALATAASAVSTVGIGSAIGKFGFGWLCDYIQAKYVLAIGVTCEAIGVIILMTINSASPVFLIYTYAFIFGLGMGSWLPSMSMAVSSTFGLASYGVIFGVVNLIWGIGSSLGPVAAGFIFDYTGNYFWAFVVVLIMYAIAVPSMLIVRTPRVKTSKV